MDFLESSSKIVLIIPQAFGTIIMDVMSHQGGVE